MGVLEAYSSDIPTRTAFGQPLRCVHGWGVASLDREEAWRVWVSDAKRPFGYTRNMRTVKVLTGALSSSVTVDVVSASAVVSDILPEGRAFGGLIYGISGVAGVDGPASASL